MATKLSMVRDINGVNTFGVPPSTNKESTVLSAGVAQTYTVPVSGDNTEWLAIFYIEPGSSVWMAHNATATLPTGSFTTTDSEGNVPAWIVSGGDTISFITNNTTAEVGVKVYAL